MNERGDTRSFLVLAAIFLAVISGVTWRLWIDSTDNPDEEDGDEPEAEVARPVVASAAVFSADTATPVVGAVTVLDTLWIRVGAEGVLAASRADTIVARTTGRVSKVVVAEGQAVRAGQLLAVIDSSEAEFEVASERLALSSARAEYESLVASARVGDNTEAKESRERYAAARSGLEQRRAALARAELRLERAASVAPFSGRVANLRVVEGEWVSAGSPIVTVLDMDPVKVEVSVPEGELPKLEVGRRALVNLAAYPGEAFNARVSTINPLIHPRERTGRVTIDISNPSGGLLPGMFARVLLDVEGFPNRTIIPRSALLQRSETLDRHVVFVYSPEGNVGGEDEWGVSDWRYVNPGMESDTHVEILAEGPEAGIVRPGEIVLVDGHHYLSHDTKVRLVENVAVAGGRPTR